jgi:hypothetical protein
MWTLTNLFGSYARGGTSRTIRRNRSLGDSFHNSVLESRILISISIELHFA